MSLIKLALRYPFSRTALRIARHLYDLVLSQMRPITPSVRIMLVRDGMTLLVHHTYASKWYFPGGGVKRGETLVECAAREAFEEVGALVRDEPRLLGIYFYQVYGRSDHIAVFVSEQFDFTTPTDLWEIEGRAWYALNALPPDIASSCRQRVLEYQAGGGPYLGSW